MDILHIHDTYDYYETYSILYYDYYNHSSAQVFSTRLEYAMLTNVAKVKHQTSDNAWSVTNSEDMKAHECYPNLQWVSPLVILLSLNYRAFCYEHIVLSWLGLRPVACAMAKMAGYAKRKIDKNVKTIQNVDSRLEKGIIDYNYSTSAWIMNQCEDTV